MLSEEGRSPLAAADRERFFTSATVITLVRTAASLACSLVAVLDDDLRWLVAGLVVYWAGDTLDGAVARWTDSETRIGAVVDILSDRLNAAGFYVGLAWLSPVMAAPVAVYLFEFMVVDAYLSLAFLAWPLKGPNYFHVVDRRIWLWNWSMPGKALNSGLFAVLLLTTGWWIAGLVVALGLLVLKVRSTVWLLRLGMPIPSPQTAES